VRPHAQGVGAGVLNEDIVTLLNLRQGDLAGDDVAGKTEWTGDRAGFALAGAFETAATVGHRNLMMPLFRPVAQAQKQVGPDMDHGGIDLLLLFDILHPAGGPAAVGVQPAAEFGDHPERAIKKPGQARLQQGGILVHRRHFRPGMVGDRHTAADIKNFNAPFFPFAFEQPVGLKGELVDRFDAPGDELEFAALGPDMQMNPAQPVITEKSGEEGLALLLDRHTEFGIIAGHTQHRDGAGAYLGIDAHSDGAGQRHVLEQFIDTDEFGQRVSIDMHTRLEGIFELLAAFGRGIEDDAGGRRRRFLRQTEFGQTCRFQPQTGFLDHFEHSHQGVGLYGNGMKRLLRKECDQFPDPPLQPGEIVKDDCGILIPDH